MADEVVKAIFQLEIEAKGVEEGLRAVAGHYAKTTEAVSKQTEQIKALTAEEQKLVAARQKSSSPSYVIAYDKKIAEVRGNIEKLTQSTRVLAGAESRVASESNRVAEGMKKAFNATAITGAANGIREAETRMQSVGNETRKTEEKTKSLRAQLKDLKTQLAAEDLDDGEFQRLSIEAGKLQDRISDAADAAKVFATDSPFEAVGNALGSVGSKLLSLDFAGAAQQSQLLVKASSQITFSQALTGIKQLGQTLFNVGKALLTNPLFLIGSVIAAVIINFDKLKNSGGLIGKVFTFIGDAINQAVKLLSDFTDMLGLTNNKFEDFITKSLDAIQKQTDAANKVRSARIEILKAMGKDTEKAEQDQAKFTADRIKKQIALLEYLKRVNGKLTEEQVKQEEELKDKLFDAIKAQKISEATENKKRVDDSKKAAQDIGKVFDDLRKKLEEEKTKTSEFNIKTRVDEGSREQLEAQFALRKKLEAEAQKELEKNTLKELKGKENITKAKGFLEQIAAQQAVNFTNDKNKAIIDLENKLQSERIELEKASAERLVDIGKAQGTLSEEEQLQARRDLLVAYYNERDLLLRTQIEKEKEAGFSTLESEKQLADLRREAAKANFQTDDELVRFRINARQAELSETEKHQLALADITEMNQVDRLEKEVNFEEQKLEIMRKGGKATEEELIAQIDKINELKAKAREEEKDEEKKRVEEIIDGIQKVLNAAFDAAQTFVQIELDKYDRLTSLQQKRVADAKAVAERGNAELLEQEQIRLDELNKKKAEFVRRQQTIAAVELVTNSAIAITKAAAEGGAAAPFTIAATIIALVAGLAQARAVAEQAAFYEGGMFEGQGYTGDGNPRESASGVGAKPYIYHKKEFIFNNQTTSKYRDIFEQIHKGKVNLNDWRDKVVAFDSLNKAQNMQLAQAMFPVQMGSDNSELKSQLEMLTKVVRNQSMSLTLDENGFEAHLRGIALQKDYIKKLAKA